MNTEDNMVNAIFEAEGLTPPVSVSEEAPKEEAPKEEVPTEETPKEETAETPGTEVPEMGKEEPGTEVPTEEATKEEPSNEELEISDSDKYIDEMSNGMFKSEAEFKESGLLELPDKYDQLVDEYNQLVEEGAETREPEFASDYVKGLNDFILNGGDPKVYAEVVSVDYAEKSEFDVMKIALKANDGLTDQEATDYLNNKYKLDTDEFTDQEMRMGTIELKRDAKSERESLVNLQKEAMTPRQAPETQAGPTEEEISKAHEERLDSWDETVTKETESISSLEYDFGFKYEISEEQKDLIDDKVFDIIDKSGLEYTQENVDTVKQMAQNLFIQDNHQEMMKAAYDFGVSKTQEEKIKSDHNPSAVPETEVPETTVAKTRSDHAIDMIERAEGVKLR